MCNSERALQDAADRLERPPGIHLPVAKAAALLAAGKSTLEPMKVRLGPFRR